VRRSARSSRAERLPTTLGLGTRALTLPLLVLLPLVLLLMLLLLIVPALAERPRGRRVSPPLPPCPPLGAQQEAWGACAAAGALREHGLLGFFFFFPSQRLGAALCLPWWP